MQKFLVLLLVAAFAFISMPAMAQAPAADKSIDFYGQVYFWTGYEKNDKKVENKANPDNPAKDAGYEQTDLSWKIEYPVTRFGARFKQGNFKANVEINTGDTDGKVMNFRQWWGEHTFTGLGGLRLLIGHTYAPTYVPAYVNDRGGLNGYAGSFTLTADRTSMIRLTMPAGPGNVMFAAIKPSEKTPSGVTTTDTTTYTAPAGGGTVTSGTTKAPHYLQNPYPKFELVYNLDMKMDAVGIKGTLGGGYNVLDIYAKTATATDDAGDKIASVKSYGFGGSACVTVGPFGTKLSAHMSKNGAEYGDNSAFYKATLNADGDIDDTDTLGLHACAYYDINPMYKVKGGYGRAMSETTTGGIKKESVKSLMYAGVDIKMTSNIMVQPEFCIKDNGEEKVDGTKTKRGKETHYGILWFLNF